MVHNLTGIAPKIKSPKPHSPSFTTARYKKYMKNAPALTHLPHQAIDCNFPTMLSAQVSVQAVLYFWEVLHAFVIESFRVTQNSWFPCTLHVTGLKTDGPNYITFAADAGDNKEITEIAEIMTMLLPLSIPLNVQIFGKSTTNNSLLQSDVKFQSKLSM